MHERAAGAVRKLNQESRGPRKDVRGEKEDFNIHDSQGIFNLQGDAARRRGRNRLDRSWCRRRWESRRGRRHCWRKY